MLLIISRSIFISLSISLIIASSPLAIGLWILLIALISSWLRGILFNSWFAIVIFLIYIGGILVIFAYFTALTPNQPLGIITLRFSRIIAFTIRLILFIISPSSFPNLYSTPLLCPSAAITTLFLPRNIPLLLLLAVTLFFILVAVVKIAILTIGPLRPFQ